VIEATYKRVEVRCQELELLARDKGHAHDMLLSDKAYLTQQVRWLLEARRCRSGAHACGADPRSPQWFADLIVGAPSVTLDMLYTMCVYIAVQEEFR
jgi:hypothetical protein